MYPDLYRRIVEAGHRIGNHTYSHQKGWGMSLERYIEDVDFANDLLHTELFRPPYARITPAQARALAKRYKLVMWDVLSRDYNRALSPRTCLRNVTRYLEGGSIVVFHDSEKSFRNMSYALPAHASSRPRHGTQMQGDRPVSCTRRQAAGGRREALVRKSPPCEAPALP